MNVDEDALGKPRNYIQDQAVNISTRHRDVARVNKEDVTGRELRENGGINVPQKAWFVADIEAGDWHAGSWIDADDLS